MGSVHNDLHSWAAKARRQGRMTIEIDLETADRASEKIVELSNRVMDLEHSLRSTHPAPATADKLRVAVEALERIARWFGEFPDTGRNWPNDDGSDSDRPMSYGAVNGSNGERDFMRHVARQALAALNEGGKG